jgi:MraZ protein
MSNFIGEYTCRLDDKGRVMLPSAFIKQMDGTMDRFVLKKDVFQPCLVLYPINEFEQKYKILKEGTNPYNREESNLLRGFLKGAAEVSLDSNNRLLIPRRLLDEIGADHEIIIAGQMALIEFWTREGYDQVESDSENYAQKTEKIMGNRKNQKETENNHAGE